MGWWEISVQVDGEAAEAVVELFDRLGHGGAVVEQVLAQTDDAHRQDHVVWVKTYLPEGKIAKRRQIEEGLWHLSMLYPIPQPEIRLLKDEDWAEAWKKHYDILHVGRRTVIVPAWKTYPPQSGEIVIHIEPGMAFGTGLHPTTRLCLLAMEDLSLADAQVLDMGTGSGILAIAAARMGAAKVLAMDVDQVAVTSARTNVRLNQVDGRVTVVEGSLPELLGVKPSVDELPRWALEPQPFDVILINILAHVISQMLDQGIASLLRPDGYLIASGIIDDQAAEIEHTMQAHGLQIVARHQIYDWIGLVACPSHKE